MTGAAQKGTGDCVDRAWESREATRAVEHLLSLVELPRDFLPQPVHHFEAWTAADTDTDTQSVNCISRKATRAPDVPSAR